MPRRPAAPRLLPLCVAACLAACANPSEPVQWRLQVRTVDGWADPALLSERVAEVGGVAVPEPARPIAPRWYAVSLQCPTKADCKHAMMKLAAQPALFLELRRDDRRAIPSRPSGPSTQ